MQGLIQLPRRNNNHCSFLLFSIVLYLSLLFCLIFTEVNGLVSKSAGVITSKMLPSFSQHSAVFFQTAPRKIITPANPWTRAKISSRSSTLSKSKKYQQRRVSMKDQQEKPVRNKLLVVGLGNPGEEYTYTRHNAGFLAADELAKRLGIDMSPKSAFLGSYGSGSYAGKSVGILKPKTYMNRSGESIRKVMDYFKITPSEVLVLVDEVALDFGSLRLRAKGSAGGHNGLKSCQSHLKTQEYPRLRIGVGAPKVDLVKHVLGEFSKAERAELDSFISSAAEVAEHWIEEDSIQKVMNLANASKKQTA